MTLGRKRLGISLQRQPLLCKVIYRVRIHRVLVLSCLLSRKVPSTREFRTWLGLEDQETWNLDEDTYYIPRMIRTQQYVEIEYDTMHPSELTSLTPVLSHCQFHQDQNCVYRPRNCPLSTLVTLKPKHPFSNACFLFFLCMSQNYLRTLYNMQRSHIDGSLRLVHDIQGVALCARYRADRNTNTLFISETNNRETGQAHGDDFEFLRTNNDSVMLIRIHVKTP